jgi:hypothetical protein
MQHIDLSWNLMYDSILLMYEKLANIPDYVNRYQERQSHLQAQYR